MKKYIARRILQAIPLVFVILTLNFVIIQLAPGDPVDFLVSGLESVPDGYVEMLKEKYGFNKPIHEQLIIYISKLLQGDFGYSFYYHRPVFGIIAERFKNTILLTFTTLVLDLVGIPLGILASKKVYSLTDNLITILTLVTFNMPSFWLAMMLILTLSFYGGLFPLGGMWTIGVVGIEKVFSILHHLALPVLTLTIGRLASYTRYTRASMLEVLRLDYITTARAKGLDENTVLYKHGFRNALIPIVTLSTSRLRRLFGGSVLVETVFSWPGLGRLMSESIFRRDYNIIMANFFVLSILTISFNLLADILYAYVDPRVRFK